MLICHPAVHQGKPGVCQALLPPPKSDLAAVAAEHACVCVHMPTHPPITYICTCTLVHTSNSHKYTHALTQCIHTCILMAYSHSGLVHTCMHSPRWLAAHKEGL